MQLSTFLLLSAWHLSWSQSMGLSRMPTAHKPLLAINAVGRILIEGSKDQEPECNALESSIEKRKEARRKRAHERTKDGGGTVSDQEVAMAEAAQTQAERGAHERRKRRCDEDMKKRMAEFDEKAALERAEAERIAAEKKAEAEQWEKAKWIEAEKLYAMHKAKSFPLRLTVTTAIIRAITMFYGNYSAVSSSTVKPIEAPSQPLEQYEYFPWDEAYQEPEKVAEAYYASKAAAAAAALDDHHGHGMLTVGDSGQYYWKRGLSAASWQLGLLGAAGVVLLILFGHRIATVGASQ